MILSFHVPKKETPPLSGVQPFSNRCRFCLLALLLSYSISSCRCPPNLSSPTYYSCLHIEMVCRVPLVPSTLTVSFFQHSADFFVLIIILQSVEANIRARFYPTHGANPQLPRAVMVKTRRANAQSQIQQPFADAFVNGFNIQPWTHNLVVTVDEGVGHQYSYAVFFKRHKKFRPNRSISRLANRSSTLRSEVVVMKIGGNGYVNMGGHLDAVRVNWLVKRYAPTHSERAERALMASCLSDLPEIPGSRM
jgi:hypothetical protein